MIELSANRRSRPSRSRRRATSTCAGSPTPAGCTSTRRASPAAGARLLPRRRGAGAGGRLPRAGDGRAGRPPRAVPDVRAGGAGARRPVPQPATVRPDAGRTRHRSRTAGAARCGGSAPPSPRVPHLRERALEGSTVAPDCAPRTGARWRSPRSARRRCSPCCRGTSKARALMTAVAIAVGRPAARQGVAVAGAAAELRQRRVARGPARRGRRAGFALARRGRPRPAGLAARPADSATGICRSSRPGAAVRGRPARRSTSSRSRWPRWPTPARGRTRIAGRQRWAEGSRARRGMVPRRQRLRHPDARPGVRGRLRRSGALRAQREPGRGVHFGAAVDAAAGRRWRCTSAEGRSSLKSAG